jgi:hypothetical protein
MTFRPGVSGNAKGRPRVGASLADALRRRFPPERVVDIAERMVESLDERVRMVALQFIADRGYGKVVTATDHESDGEDAIDVSHIPIEERRSMLTAITRMAALSAPVPESDGVEH